MISLLAALLASQLLSAAPCPYVPAKELLANPTLLSKDECTLGWIPADGRKRYALGLTASQRTDVDNQYAQWLLVHAAEVQPVLVVVRMCPFVPPMPLVHLAEFTSGGCIVGWTGLDLRKSYALGLDTSQRTAVDTQFTTWQGGH